MNNISNISKTESPDGSKNSGLLGLSSNRSGHQAFNLITRVRTPLTLFCFLLFCCTQLIMFARIRFGFAAQTLSNLVNLLRHAINTWCCRLVVEDSALSARKSGVRLPSAPRWEGSSNGKTTVCGIVNAGSIPVLSPKFSQIIRDRLTVGRNSLKVVMVVRVHLSELSIQLIRELVDLSFRASGTADQDSPRLLIALTQAPASLPSSWQRSARFARSNAGNAFLALSLPVL